MTHQLDGELLQFMLGRDRSKGKKTIVIAHSDCIRWGIYVRALRAILHDVNSVTL